MVFPIGKRGLKRQRSLAHFRARRTDFCSQRKPLSEREEETESMMIGVPRERERVKPAVGLAMGVSGWEEWEQPGEQPRGVGDLSDVSPWK